MRRHGPGQRGRRPPAPGSSSGTVTVFAAASLTDVFTELGDRLTADQPGLDVQFNFAGSSALATQITQGAPADVFASANQAQMAVVTGAGLADGDPTVFTENVLEIAVPPGNPAGVSGPGRLRPRGPDARGLRARGARAARRREQVFAARRHHGRGPTRWRRTCARR